MALAANPYLRGNFAPTHEEVSLPCTQVEGTIPKDLAGFFLRTGPNNQFEPIDPEAYHPFDGDGMVHAVEIRGGEASYRNRWVRTAGFERERKQGRAIWGGFNSIGKMEPPADAPMMKNLANTALAWHANRLLALWEAGAPHELRLPSLETVGEYDFGGGWPHAVSAHPKVDPRTGVLIVFCYSPVAQPYVRYGVVDARGVVKHSTGIELPGAPVMIHDMAITERHSLIFDMPVTFSIERVMNGGHAFDWEPANGSRVGIIPRYGDGSQVRWFDVQTGYIFHVFNAWDEGDEVVLEACRTARTSILDTSRDMQADEQARFHRYRFNVTSGKASEERIGDIPVEFSRINETCVGVPTRYGYAARFHPTRGLLFDGVVKHDRQGDRREVVEFAANQFGQEFVFAPRVESRAEDDGYVIGFVHDEGENATECWVIDAQRFAAGPVARIRTPHTVPYGFHSHWVSSADAAKQARA